MVGVKPSPDDPEAQTRSERAPSRSDRGSEPGREADSREASDDQAFDLLPAINLRAGRVVRLLDAGMHYGEISRTTGASTATITRIASWLHHGEGGYRRMLTRLAERSAAGTNPYPTGSER